MRFDNSSADKSGPFRNALHRAGFLATVGLLAVTAIATITCVVMALIKGWPASGIGSSAFLLLLLGAYARNKSDNPQRHRTKQRSHSIVSAR